MNDKIIYDLQFNKDWNVKPGQTAGKLQCNCFLELTIEHQIYNPETIHRVFNKNNGKTAQKLGFVKVLKCTKFEYKDLNKYEGMCYLCTGEGVNETKSIIQKKYKNTIKDNTTLAFVLFRYLTQSEIVLLTENIKEQSQTKLM